MDPNITHCKDCIHRPILHKNNRVHGPKIKRMTESGHTYEMEDRTCPFVCFDSYYSCLTPDDGFCHEGESKLSLKEIKEIAERSDMERPKHI